MKSSFTYIMVTTGYIKIGVTSSSIIKRAIGVQTGCPTVIEHAHFFTYDTRSMAFEAEKKLHEKFKMYRNHGEWFVRPPKFTSKAEKCLGIKSNQIIISEPVFVQNDEKLLRRQKILFASISREQRQKELADKIISLENKDTSEMSNQEHIKYMKDQHQLNKTLRKNRRRK